MLRGIGRRGGEIGICGTCMDARGIAEGELSDTTRRSSLEELTNWSVPCLLPVPASP